MIFKKITGIAALDWRNEKIRLKANEETWTAMEIQGIQGYFSDMRINRESVPEWLHFWELADGDSDGIPCRYKPAILVNFFGTFIAAGELPVDYQECKEGYIDSYDEWGFTGEWDIPFEQVVQTELQSRYKE